MTDFYTIPSNPLSVDLLPLDTSRSSLWQSLQRGIDTRSGNLIVRNAIRDTLTVGVLADGTLGFEVIDSAGNSTFNPFVTDVTTLTNKVGAGASTPVVNRVLAGTGTGTSAWALTLAGLTLTTPTIANFTNATHDHINTAGGGNLNLSTAASAIAYTVFTPTPLGYSGTPTTTLARYIQIGKIVTMDVSFTGTSDATTATFTLPVSPKSTAVYQLIATDNGTVATSPGLLSLTASSTTADCFLTLASGVWTNTGTKVVRAFGIVYEAA